MSALSYERVYLDRIRQIRLEEGDKIADEFERRHSRALSLAGKCWTCPIVGYFTATTPVEITYQTS